MTGLVNVNVTTVWRENIGWVSALGVAGESVRGLFGWTNPLQSMIVNRSGQGLRIGASDCYDQIFNPRDVYGDLMFSGQKS